MESKKKIFFVLISILLIPAYASSECAQNSSDVCGVIQISSGLIIRGQSFSRGSFPWTVALTYTRAYPPKFFCAGILISSSFVLSAAHCINPKDSLETLLGRDVLAFFGAHNLSNYLEIGRFSLSPRKIFIHDDWNPRTSEYDGDLSVLEFQKDSIHFNDYVQPICLWDSEIEPIVTKGKVAGWGASEDPSREYEDIPKMVEVLIQPNEYCLPGKSRLAGISSNRTFCAGAGNGSGICYGDSGGGLFVKVNDLFALKGFVSSSLVTDDQCDVSSNAVYTNVFKYTDWIKTMTRASSFGLKSNLSTIFGEDLPQCSFGNENGAFFGKEGGYLKLRDSFNVGRDLTISMEIKPKSSKGVLVSVYGKRSFFIVEMINKTIMFSVDSGDGPRSTYFHLDDKDFLDDQWHELTAIKLRFIIALNFDKLTSEPNVGDPVKHTFVATYRSLFIGGYPHVTKARGIRSRKNFHGCIKNLRINGEKQAFTSKQTSGNILINKF